MLGSGAPTRRGLARWSTTATVTVADPGREFAFVTGHVDKEMTRWTYRFSSVSGATDVTESFEMLRDMPWYFRWAARVLMGVDDRQADLEGNLAATLGRLKVWRIAQARSCESRPRRAPGGGRTHTLRGAQGPKPCSSASSDTGAGSISVIPWVAGEGLRYGPDPVTDALRIGVIGDQVPGFAPHSAIDDAVTHSAAHLGRDATVEWFPTPRLEEAAADRLAGCDALWCAPGGPFASLDGALEGIRTARESGTPFLGTCAGFQHGVVECARNVVGMVDAAHPEYGGATPEDPLIVDERLCSLVGEQMAVRLVDDDTRAIYGSDEAVERYYCRFALNERHRDRLAGAGLIVAGVDEVDGGTRIMRRPDHPFFYLTLFVPQVASSAAAPHPLITAYLAAAIRTRT
jgi:Glutamine amidotransferase class-I